MDESSSSLLSSSDEPGSEIIDNPDNLIDSRRFFPSNSDASFVGTKDGLRCSNRAGARRRCCCG